MAYNFGDMMFENGQYVGNYMGGPQPAAAPSYAPYIPPTFGAGPAPTAQQQGMSAGGVPSGGTAGTYTLDQATPQALAAEQANAAMIAQRIAQLQQQNPGQYSDAGQLMQPAGLGTAAVGQGAVQTVSPAAQQQAAMDAQQQEVTKPMQVGGGLGGTPGAPSGPATSGMAPGSPAGSPTSYNPNAPAYFDDMARRQQKYLGDAMQANRGSFVDAGGLGGGRQKVVEDDLMLRAADDLMGRMNEFNLADWTGEQNRGLTRQGMRDNFWTAQRGQDIQAAGVGATLAQQGLNSEWTPYTQANSIYAPYGGNGTTTQNTSNGGGWMGGLGGALGVADFANKMGWWK